MRGEGRLRGEGREGRKGVKGCVCEGEGGGEWGERGDKVWEG